MTLNGTSKSSTLPCGENKSFTRKSACVPASDREDAVLEFIDRHDIALPPKAIFRGMKREIEITFSYRTVQNILSRLTESGYVVRCDKSALDEGEIQPLDDDDSDRRTYYFITETGRERIRAE